MEWRCEWCGAPQEADDPPCDNCGHGSFERAVVPAKDINDGEQEAAIVWECTECGRDHPKHSPPCSRCGNHTLEQTRLELDEDELNASGYLDLLTPRYVVAAVAALLLAAVVFYGLFGAGIVPGTSTDAPGDPDELDGVALGPAEEQYLDALNDRRKEAGTNQLTRDSGLDDAATELNQEVVIESYEGEETDMGTERPDVCDQQPEADFFTIGADQHGGDVADAMVQIGLQHDGVLATHEASHAGLDTHAGPDDRLFVTLVLC